MKVKWKERMTDFLLVNGEMPTRRDFYPNGVQFSMEVSIRNAARGFRMR
jgi:hypothetical protein